MIQCSRLNHIHHQNLHTDDSRFASFSSRINNNLCCWTLKKKHVRLLEPSGFISNFTSSLKDEMLPYKVLEIKSEKTIGRRKLPPFLKIKNPTWNYLKFLIELNFTKDRELSGFSRSLEARALFEPIIVDCYLRRQNLWFQSQTQKLLSQSTFRKKISKEGLNSQGKTREFVRKMKI